MPDVHIENSQEAALNAVQSELADLKKSLLTASDSKQKAEAEAEVRINTMKTFVDALSKSMKMIAILLTLCVLLILVLEFRKKGEETEFDKNLETTVSDQRKEIDALRGVVATLQNELFIIAKQKAAPNEALLGSESTAKGQAGKKLRKPR